MSNDIKLWSDNETDYLVVKKVESNGQYAADAVYNLFRDIVTLKREIARLKGVGK